MQNNQSYLLVKLLFPIIMVYLLIVVSNVSFVRNPLDAFGFGESGIFISDKFINTTRYSILSFFIGVAISSCIFKRLPLMRLLFGSVISMALLIAVSNILLNTLYGFGTKGQLLTFLEANYAFSFGVLLASFLAGVVFFIVVGKINGYEDWIWQYKR